MAKKYIAGNFSYKIDNGKVRLSNEDRALAIMNAYGNVLLVVCDGMGGENKGDLASTLAIDYIKERFNNNKKFQTAFGAYVWLNKVIRKANSLIYSEGIKNKFYNGMGTTLTAVLIVPNFIIISQVGDSRAYRLIDNHLEQMTEDQTYVEYLYKTGKIKYDEKFTHPQRHVLMNALGILPSVEIDSKIKPYDNEKILLCSDGLYNNVQTSVIESILKNDDSCEQKVNELIKIANDNGGSDNIAVVIWEANS
ncbi:MAG: Stp1/IreP family PP2C-type Ser/Thr phosphatase [Bacilli bacterium]